MQGAPAVRISEVVSMKLRSCTRRDAHHSETPVAHPGIYKDIFSFVEVNVINPVAVNIRITLRLNSECPRRGLSTVEQHADAKQRMFDLHRDIDPVRNSFLFVFDKPRP